MFLTNTNARATHTLAHQYIFKCERVCIAQRHTGFPSPTILVSTKLMCVEGLHNKINYFLLNSV